MDYIVYTQMMAGKMPGYSEEVEENRIIGGKYVLLSEGELGPLRLRAWFLGQG